MSRRIRKNSVNRCLRRKSKSKKLTRRKSKSKKLSRRKSRKLDGAWYDFIFDKEDTDQDTYERIDKFFYDSILSNNIEYIRLLIVNGGADIDNITFYGNTVSPLILAIKQNNNIIVDLLLQKGANVNILENGKSILQIACELKNPYIIQSLKKYGASGECDLNPVKRVIQKEPEPEEKPKPNRPPGGEPLDLPVAGTGEKVGVLYKTYFDLLDKKIPIPAIEAKLRAAGINPTILDLDKDKPIPPGFNLKLLEVKKAPVKVKAIQLKESAVSDFWKEKVDVDFTKEREKQFEKDYFIAIQKVKEVPAIVQDNKIIPLLNIDAKSRQNLQIAYKNLVKIMPIKAEDLNIQNINSYIKDLIMGKMPINDVNESILLILYDLVPHTKDGIVEIQKIKDIITLDKNNLNKLENGFVFDYELFIYNLLKIDDQFDRIQVLQFKKTFPTDIQSINTKIDLLIESIFKIRNSAELHELLKVLQKIVNIGGHQGGFSLTLINSILEYKSKSNPKNTIIEYIIPFLRTINFDFSNFFTDMRILENTSTFSIPDMITTITTSKKLNKIVENIDVKDKRYEDFLIQEEKIKKTEEHLVQLNNKFTELLNFYGEPEEKVDLRIYLIEVNNAIKKIKTQLTKDIEKEKAKVREATAKAKKAKV